MVIVIILLLLVLFIIAIVLGVRYVVTSKKPEDIKVSYVKTVSRVLEQCKLESENDALKKKIDTVILTLRYSDTNSTPEAAEVEGCIIGKVWELLDMIKGKKAVETNTALDELLKLVQKRNIITKHTK